MHSSYTYDRQLRGQIRFVFGYCSHGLVTLFITTKYSVLDRHGLENCLVFTKELYLRSVSFKVIALGRHGLERRFYFYSYYRDRKPVRDWPGVSDVWPALLLLRNFCSVPGFFRRLCFTFYSMPVGVISSRRAWAGQPITIILISDRQHIGGGPGFFKSLTRH